MKFLRILVPALVTAAMLIESAGAQDPPTREEQIRRIRALPPEEKRRLKEALDRFNALPPSEREALRAKAKEVGIDRLGELAGRDFPRLRRLHHDVQAEMDEVFRLLGGTERFESLSAAERAFLRAEATRWFQRHCLYRLLESSRLTTGFEQLPESEKHRVKSQALEAMNQRLLAERSDEERAKFLALPAAEQRIERAKLVAEWRLRETIPFAKKFEVQRVQPLFELPAEKRRILMEKRVRWFQLTGLLAADGVDRDVMRMLGELPADERARIGEFYSDGRDLPVVQRRERVEAKIRESYGKGAFDASRSSRSNLRHPGILRDRAMRERRRDAAPVSPAPVSPAPVSPAPDSPAPEPPR